jgi:hypothetical protein
VECNRLQYNAAVKYVEKNAYNLRVENSRALKFIIGGILLGVFYAVLRFLSVLS